MASPEQRLTMDYDVPVAAKPTTEATVKGLARKVDPADVRRLRALARADRGED